MEVHKYIIKKSGGNEDFLHDMCSRKSASTCLSFFFSFFDTKLAITNRQAEKRKTTELTEKSNRRYSVQSA